MSAYHLMRNFTALLRMLGYSRLVSMENFRRPNFPLMSDIVCFLLRRFDPRTALEPKIDTEESRLEFVRLASREMVSKAHLDINTKKLYMADMNCVPEMLKLLQIIYDAWRKLKPEDLSLDNLTEQSDGDISVNRGQFTNYSTNQLSSEILQLGTELFDLLEHEQEQKIARSSVLSKQLPLEQIEKGLRQSIQELQSNILKMQSSRDNFDQDSDDLNGKIEKKFNELERNRKRLQTLHSQRPVFMSELEKVEQEIAVIYEEYVIKARCLYFLEQKLEEFEEAEREKIEERNEEIRLMLEQMNSDELLLTNNGPNAAGQPGTTTINMDEELDIPSDDGDGISDDMSDSLERKTSNLPSGNDPKQNILRKPAERKMMANTVVVNQRSSRTARIYSYGSLLGEDGEEEDDEDDDDDDDDEDDDEDDEDEDIEDGDEDGNKNRNKKNGIVGKKNGIKGKNLAKNELKGDDSELDLDTIDSDIESSELASATDFNINARLQNSLRTAKLPTDGNDDF